MPFEVPEGWEWCTLGEIAESSLGKTLDKGKNVGKEYNYLCSINVQWDCFDLSTIKTFKLKDEEIEKYSLRKGDLLICEGGDVGRSAIWDSDEEMYYQNALHRVRFKDSITPRFFLYQLMYLKENGIIDDLCKGVTIKHLTQGVLYSIPLVLPPLAEQIRITSSIDKYFSIIDTIDNGVNAVDVLIKQAKSKILDLAIHGKLVPQDPNDEPSTELLKRINPKAVITTDNAHYPQLPESWEIISMEQVCTLADGKKESGIERINLDVKFMRGEREAKTLNEGKFTPEGTLLILVDGENSGEVFCAPCDGYQGSTFKQLIINENIYAEYLLYIIGHHRKELKENKVGSAIPHLNKKLFKAIKVPIPPYNEQVRIVEAINHTYKYLDTITESL